MRFERINDWMVEDIEIIVLPYATLNCFVSFKWVLIMIYELRDGLSFRTVIDY